MSAAVAAQARGYQRVLDEISGLTVIGAMSLPVAEREHFIRGIFERVRAGLELRADWTPAERSRALLDFGKNLVVRLSMPEIVGRA